MAYLELSGIRKSFGTTVVIPGLDLSLEQGELFVLVGPSGCGKTTILRLVAGLLSPDSGTVRCGGKDIGGLAPERRQAPMVFQDHLLFPHMTVLDNVAFGLRMGGLPRDRVARRVEGALRDVGLESMGSRYPAQLSGGQKQRVALARALVLEPRLLLLDEPFSNLDAGLRQEMRDLLESLHRRHPVTTILVTHDQEEALTLASRLAVLFAGRVAQVGTPDQVWQQPVSRQVAEFLGRPLLLPGHIARGRFTSPLLPGEGIPVVGPRADGPALAVLRPDVVRLRRAEGAGGLRGRVEGHRVAGGFLRHRVSWGQRGDVAWIPSPGATALPPGTAVRLEWDASETWYVDP